MDYWNPEYGQNWHEANREDETAPVFEDKTINNRNTESYIIASFKK